MKIQPPSAPNMEQALLGCLLLDFAKSYPKIAEWIDADDFYSPKHALIFRAMLALQDSATEVDLITVVEYLRSTGDLDKCGGVSGMADLASDLISTAAVERYAQAVHEKAQLRRIVSVAREAAVLALKPESRVDAVVDFMQSGLLGAAVDRRRVNRMVSSADLAQRTVSAIESISVRDTHMLGCPTGFDGLDTITCGLSAGNLIIVAARPSMGKTVLATAFAKATATAGAPVGVFSLEMEAESLMMRMLADQSNISLRRIRLGRLDREGFLRLNAAANTIGTIPIFFDDEAGLRFDRLRSRARQLKIEHNIGLLIVDYLQLIQPTGRFDGRNDWVTYLSNSLKVLAKELQIPVVVLSQLSRALESRGGDRRPILSDLRDSGAIEQDADLVLFVYRPVMYKEFIKSKVYKINGTDYAIDNIAEIIIAKQRNGALGSVPLIFDGPKTRFLPVAREQDQLNYDLTKEEELPF